MRRTRTRDWVLSILMIPGGLAALALGEYDQQYGTTPRGQLTYVRGQATNVSFSQLVGRWGQTTDYVDFNVYGRHTQYGSNMPGYPQVVNAVRGGQMVTLGFSAKQDKFVATPSYVPLYELWLGNQPLVTYADTLAYKAKGLKAIRISGGLFLVGGLVGLINCYRRREVRSMRPVGRW